jgi:photosystem II stability/assembly factor-like uncharacterized protein
MRFSLVVILGAAFAITGCGGGSNASSAPTSTPAALAVNHAHSIVVMPGNPDEVLMGAHYRLYKSINGGKSWHPLVKQMVLSMVLDPAHPSTIYAVSLQKGLEKSVDGGAHWTPLGVGISKGHLTGVAFAPASHALFAYGVGIYRSTTGGVQWSNVLAKQSIYNIAAGAGGTVYAASSNGLYVSHDAGLHWTVVSSIGNQPVVQAAAAGKVAYAIAAVALMKSTDGGHTWKPLSKAPAGIEFLGVSPTNPDEVFGEIGAQGFVISRDGGITWRKADQGITDRNFNASVVRVSPSSPNVVYTAAWGLHFYASTDGGQHWTRTATLIH